MEPSELLPKPMLAKEIERDKLKFPLLASTKLDGIRCMLHPHPNKSVTDSLPMSRSLKPIQNRHIASMLSKLPAGLDGELGVLSAETGAVDFRNSTSSVMRRDGQPSFTYFVFDNWLDNRPFKDRYAKLVATEFPSWVHVVAQHRVKDHETIDRLFAAALAEGNEGLILRRAEDPYAHGSRSSMWKVKPWEDSEGVVVDVIEEQHNGNEAETNELGRTKRSSAKAGKTGKGRAGVLVLRDDKLWPGVTFEVTGMTDKEKADWWANKPIGQLCKYKYLRVGGYDKPRHGGILGLRHPDDTNS